MSVELKHHVHTRRGGNATGAAVTVYQSDDHTTVVTTGTVGADGSFAFEGGTALADLAAGVYHCCKITTTSSPAEVLWFHGCDKHVVANLSSFAVGNHWVTWNVVTKTANYTATANDDVVLVDATAGPVTITLPAVAGITHTIDVQKIDASANTVTVDANLAETINGAATFVLRQNGDDITLLPTASGWRIK